MLLARQKLVNRPQTTKKAPLITKLRKVLQTQLIKTH
jgi:hypothetical protein